MSLRLADLVTIVLAFVICLPLHFAIGSIIERWRKRKRDARQNRPSD